MYRIRVCITKNRLSSRCSSSYRVYKLSITYHIYIYFYQFRRLLFCFIAAQNYEASKFRFQNWTRKFQFLDFVILNLCDPSFLRELNTKLSSWLIEIFNPEISVYRSIHLIYLNKETLLFTCKRTREEEKKKTGRKKNRSNHITTPTTTRFPYRFPFIGNHARILTTVVRETREADFPRSGNTRRAVKTCGERSCTRRRSGQRR